MGLPLFWLFILAACLLWSATFSAAAARSARFPSLLSLAAWLVPVLLLVPAVALTRFLASGPKPYAVNYFAAAVALLLTAFIGGVWITIAGRQPSAHGTPVARRWPVIGLAGLCGMAAIVAYGTLVAIDNAATAEAVQARFEAASLMQANLPPAVADADNAAPLHRHAAALLAADDTTNGWYFCLKPDDALDIQSPEVAALLTRHAETLDLIRQAADKNACRFDRDWSRPSLGMCLPEIQGIREEAGLLALAARRCPRSGGPGARCRNQAPAHRRRAPRIAQRPRARPALGRATRSVLRQVSAAPLQADGWGDARVVGRPRRRGRRRPDGTRHLFRGYRDGQRRLRDVARA
jgi:hypothetical protein